MANVKKVVEDTKEVEQTVDTNIQILEMMKQMQEALAQTQAELEAVKEEKKALEKVQNKQSMSLDDYVKVIHMLQGGTMLESTNVSVRFEELFETWDIKKTDLKEMVKNQKFKHIFQEVGVYICDRDFVKELQLDKYYDKYKLNENTFHEMLDMSYNEIIAKLGMLAEDLQYSFKIFVVEEHKSGNKKAEAREVLSAVSDFFKADIYALLK